MGSATVFSLAVAVGVLGIGLLFIALTLGVRESRLSRRYAGERMRDAMDRAGSQDAWVAGMAEGGARLDRLLQGADETRVLLAQAGWRDASARRLFYAFQFGLPTMLGGLSLFVFGVVGVVSGSLLAWLMMLIVLILSLLLPRYALRARATRRRERLTAEVPLFINVLILLADAGLNLRQALSSIVRDGAHTMPTLVEELAPLIRQIDAGADVDAVLFETGKLLAIEELDTVFGILRQVERYGGELRQPLLETVDNLRSKRSMALREQVNIMSGKMTVVLVTCFFPPLLIFIAGPAFVSISRTLGNL